jgi:hypothetical protein
LLETFRNLFKIPDLKKRLLFTLGMLVVVRLGSHLPLPGIDKEAMANLFSQGGILGFFDLFAGGALSRFSVFALGIMPYINASIIMNLLTAVVPTLEQWAKEGEEGQNYSLCNSIFSYCPGFRDKCLAAKYGGINDFRIWFQVLIANYSYRWNLLFNVVR